MKRSRRFKAITVVAALCAWGLIFELCRIPWVQNNLLTGTSASSTFWVWERPKDVLPGISYTFDSVGMRKQIGNAAIIVLIAGGLTLYLLRREEPSA